ncbi:hypothetical protein [Bradyrhizobium sp. MOS002]|uniref:hypothetical protein n=1 Tax=Bradyrhizobium sp. MOS002 TaxID=2133947 RepID=UPI000D132DF7|nr:hypothetical protein [Bradyrhizobium sp. MOS002]PSO33416.1 hypothetical protein C7G41_00045 [Bradyrhizobium sp. MOS002]
MKRTILALLAVLALAAPASATPGAVNAQGCHGARGKMGYHCHGHNTTSKFRTSNRRYVAFRGG